MIQIVLGLAFFLIGLYFVFSKKKPIETQQKSSGSSGKEENKEKVNKAAEAKKTTVSLEHL